MKVLFMGYIGTKIPAFDNENLARNKARRLILSPELKIVNDKEILNDFQIKTDDGYTLSGNYDIVPKQRLLALHYLNFVPIFKDNEDYSITTDFYTPKDYRYFIQIFVQDTNFLNGLEFEVDYSEMCRSGGVKIFQIPPSVKELKNLEIEIGVKKNNGDFVKLMIEPEWDIVIDDWFCIFNSTKKSRYCV